MTVWRRHCNRYAFSAFRSFEQPQARRLRALESENAKLKKLLAEAHLDNAALKDLLTKKW